MSEVKHTPGPWSSTYNEHRGTYQIHADNGTWVATTRDGTVKQEANALLIAAAPDLLEMLKVAQLWLDVDGRFDMQGINAAIAKAEGRV